MAIEVLYFGEYIYHNSVGDSLSPYISNCKWCIGGESITLQELGKMCVIYDEELSVLRLTYGA